MHPSPAITGIIRPGAAALLPAKVLFIVIPFSYIDSNHTAHRRARWLWLCSLLALLGLGLWDVSGLDLWVMQHIATPSGFALTDNYWLGTVLHTGARKASIGLFAALWLLTLAWPTNTHAQLGRREQRAWLLMGVTLSLMLISALKAASTTSCPWDLAQFGGAAQYVSHWAWGQTDGGGGRCFPGGHASSAFGYLALLPPLLLASDRRTQTWGKQGFWAILLVGLVLGLTQTLRGAHYPSHTLWTAWICWISAWAWYALGQWLGAVRRGRKRSNASPTQAEV